MLGTLLNRIDLFQPNYGEVCHLSSNSQNVREIGTLKDESAMVHVTPQVLQARLVCLQNVKYQKRWKDVMRCAIWYLLYNLKNVKNTH